MIEHRIIPNYSIIHLEKYYYGIIEELLVKVSRELLQAMKCCGEKKEE